MKLKWDTKTITALALFLALEILLQFIGNMVGFGPVSINLSLVPIAIVAILYGPLAGMLLGLANGIIVLLSPSTAIFYSASLIGTLITCLLKCTIAGFISGLIPLIFKSKSKLFVLVISAILVPIINSGLFALFCLVFFKATLESNMQGFSNFTAYLFLGMIGWNFIFEFISCLLLTPTICKVLAKVKQKNEHTN